MDPRAGVDFSCVVCSGEQQMISPEQLISADLERRRAMIEADEEALERLFSDELTWTHSSGKTESKTEMIAAILGRDVVYEALDVEEAQVRCSGDLCVHNGILQGSASRAGQTKLLRAKFLAVWRAIDDDLILIAWQSTNCSE
tara:strand:- start:24 stop:452 length:429 start_codon:yes stop_codon:yes gene_type:complete